MNWDGEANTSLRSEIDRPDINFLWQQDHPGLPACECAASAFDGACFVLVYHGRDSVRTLCIRKKKQTIAQLLAASTDLGGCRSADRLGICGSALPGLAWWLWFGDRRKDGAQALAEIFAISASFIALGALGFYTVRLKFSPLLLGILLGLCFGVAFAGLIRRGKGAFNKTWLFALLGFAVALVWRFWQARDLVSIFGDSQTHVLIILK